MAGMFREETLDASGWPSMIAQLEETPRVEYKSVDVLKKSRYQLERACMAMANNEDGGWIVVGVDKVGNDHVLTGISDEILSALDRDNLKITLSGSGYPDMDIRFSIEEFDAKKFLLIYVAASQSMPVISLKSDGNEGRGCVRPGVIYCRVHGPATVPISAPLWHRLWSRYADKERFYGMKIAATLKESSSTERADARRFFEDQAKDI